MLTPTLAPALAPMLASPSGLQVAWYLLVAVLWTGYFFLEGFDYGVAMLIPVVGRGSDTDRRIVINTIGPVWDGNEVWLITAAGATFAAFPGWYATEFSGLYFPMFLVLAGLILRGVSFEYRALRPQTAWRRAFDRCATWGSFLPAAVFGMGFSNFVKGVRVGADQNMAQSLWSLFNPFGLLGGALFVLLFLTHGAVFITLKTRGEVHDRARRVAMGTSLVTAVVLLAWVLVQNLAWPASRNPWLQGSWVNGSLVCWVAGLVAVVGVLAAGHLTRLNRNGLAFASTGMAILMLGLTIFTHMYGNLGFVSQAGNPLDITTAASSVHTMHLMTWAACLFLPIVLAYQAWSYWVFRRRLSTRNMPPEHGAAAPLTEAAA